MINAVLITVGILLIHLLCGLICITVMLNNHNPVTIITILLLSIMGPIIILIWVIGDIYCWILANIKKFNERRRTKK